MVIIRNTTAIVNMEYARSASKMSDIMVASTSHDMKTPLNTIRAMHETMLKCVKDKNVLNFLQVAITSTNLLLYLISDTLDFYEIKSGKFKLKNTPLNLKSMIKEAFSMISI